MISNSVLHDRPPRKRGPLDWAPITPIVLCVYIYI